ncbi:MAG: 4-hydroxy-tetrahydrodipicolinate synthase [Promethearchaeota archaeon]
MRSFKGVMPPMITPFDSKYKINEEMLKRLTNYLVESGLHGLVPTGSTGEFSRLTDEERKKVIKTVVDVVNGRIPVIAGTAANRTEDVIALSKYAEDVGADGVMITVPYYGRPTEEELLGYYKDVASSIGVPIVVYNNPWTTGTDLKPDFLAKLTKYENIRHVKEATCDTRRVNQIIRATNGKMAVISGADDNTFESFVAGATGWIAGIANFMPKTCVKLYDLAVEKKKIMEAKELWYKILPIGDIVEGSGKFVQYIKAGVELRGIAAGPPRKPLLPLSATEKETFQKMLADFS